MATATSVIKSLYYVSPYAVLPPGVGTAGITLQTDSSQSPTPSTVTNPVLVIRLRLASSSASIGVSATSGAGTGATMANYQPSFPLSATENYMIDIIWVSSGTPPENIDWDNAVTSAPVLAAEVTIKKATQTTATVLALELAYGSAGVGTGAKVNIYALSGGVYVNVGSAQTDNAFVNLTFTSASYPPPYFLTAQTAIPVSNTDGSGGFSAPFSLGPQSLISNSCSIPQAATLLNSAVYNGKNLSLAWTLGSIAGAVSPKSSIIQLFLNGQMLTTFIGGPVSANLPIDISGQTGLTVQVSTVLNGIASLPISFSMIAEVPSVTNVTADQSAGTVTASVSTATAGLAIQACLMDDDKLLAGPVMAVSGLVIFNYVTSDGMVGLNIVANSANAGASITGPKSTPAVLLATAPVIKSGYIRTNPADSTTWLLDFEWDALPDAAESVTKYNLVLFQDNISLTSINTSATAASFSVAKTAIDLSKTQAITLQAVGITGGNSPATNLALLFSPPLLTALNTTTNQIDLSWSSPTIPPANTMPVSYQAQVLLNNSVVYTSAKTRATRISIPLSAVPDAAMVILVNIALGVIVLQTEPAMATACSASPILDAPTTGLVSAAALSNLATLNWSAVTGATAYSLNFTNGNVQNNINTNSFQLSAALSPDTQLGYTVTANGSSNGVPVTGPPSTLAFIPVSTANISALRFNGTLVELSWEAVADAICYNVLVYDNSSPVNTLYNANTTEASTSFEVSIVSGKIYRAYVQPVTAGGTGLCGVTEDLFGTGIYLSQQPAATAYPYTYIAQAMAALGNETSGPVPVITNLYLPELGATAGALGTVPITVVPFTIAPSNDPDLPYLLTIAADALAWDFDTDSIRAALQSAYTTFLESLESPPAGGLTGATPYGISLVQAAIARALPQTFTELLYYNFGLSTVSTVGSGYVDLRPGMILRVMASDYVSIAQSGVATWINGYAGATVLDFEIGSYNTATDWRVGFDSFLSNLSAQGAITVSTPPSSSATVQAGLTGSADLYYPQFIQPFYRLYFPAAIDYAWGNGSNTTNTNFTMVAASTYKNLQGTTVDTTTTPTAYFRGRTIVEVLIKVMINGNERLVPVGTSLGNLLDQLGLCPSANSPVFRQLRVYRSIVSAITDLDVTSALGPQLELYLDWMGFTSYGSGNGLTVMSVPLLSGDQIFTDKY